MNMHAALVFVMHAVGTTLVSLEHLSVMTTTYHFSFIFLCNGFTISITTNFYGLDAVNS